jgi:hypothetical protein
MTNQLQPPGTVAVPGVRFLYVESPNQRAFDKFFPEVGRWLKANSLLASGGLITQNVVITIPSGARFFGISFHGAEEIWNRGVVEAARERGYRIGRLDGSVLIVDDERIDLSSCEIEEFEY